MACESCARGKTRCDEVNELGCRRCRLLNKADCSARRSTSSTTPTVDDVASRLDSLQRQVDDAQEIARRSLFLYESLATPTRKRKRSPERGHQRQRSTDRNDYHWSASPHDMLLASVSGPSMSRSDIKHRTRQLLADPVETIVTSLEMLTCEVLFKQRVVRTIPFEPCLSTLDSLSTHPFHRTCILAYLARLPLDPHPLSRLQCDRVDQLVRTHVDTILREDIRDPEVAQGFFILSLGSSTWLGMAEMSMQASNVEHRLRKLSRESWSEAWLREDVEMARLVKTRTPVDRLGANSRSQFLAIRNQRAFSRLFTSISTTSHDDALELHLQSCLSDTTALDRHLLYEISLRTPVTRCLSAFDILSLIDCPIESDVQLVITTVLSAVDDLRSMPPPPPTGPSSHALTALNLSLCQILICRCLLAFQALPTPLPPDVRFGPASRTYLPLYRACADLIRSEPPNPLTTITRMSLGLAYRMQFATHQYVSQMSYAHTPDHVMSMDQLQATVDRLELVDPEMSRELRESTQLIPWVKTWNEREAVEERMSAGVDVDPLWLALFGFVEGDPAATSSGV